MPFQLFITSNDGIVHVESERSTDQVHDLGFGGKVDREVIANLVTRMGNDLDHHLRTSTGPS